MNTRRGAFNIYPRGHFIHLFLTEEVEEKTDPTSCKGRDILAPADGEWRLQLAWPLPSLEFPRLKCKPPLKTGDRLPLKQPCLPCSLSPFFLTSLLPTSRIDGTATKNILNLDVYVPNCLQFRHFGVSWWTWRGSSEGCDGGKYNCIQWRAKRSSGS